MPVGIGSELTPNSTFQNQFDGNLNPGALVDIGFIRGAFKVFPLESDFVDSDGNNIFANVGLFSNNQIIFAQDTHKLYQFSEEIEGGIQFEADGFTPVFVDGVPVIIDPSPAKWIEFQFSGSSTGITDPITAQNITINEGGSGTKLELLDNQTLNITAQSATSLISITSESLGLTVNSKGLLELSDFDYTPSVGTGGEVLYTTLPENHLIASGNAFYLSVPDSPELFTDLIDNNQFNQIVFNEGNIKLEAQYVQTSPFLTGELYTNIINVKQGQIFEFSFNIGIIPSSYQHLFIQLFSQSTFSTISNSIFYNKISGTTTPNGSTINAPISNTSNNSFKITSPIDGDVRIVLKHAPGQTVNFSYNNIKLKQIGL